MATLSSWDLERDRSEFPRVPVSTASGAQPLIDTTATPPAITRVLPTDHDVDYLEVPDAHGHHAGRTVFVGVQHPAENEPRALTSLRADGAAVILAGTVGSVVVGEPMTMILHGLLDQGATFRTTTEVTRIEPWLGPIPSGAPSGRKTGPR